MFQVKKPNMVPDSQMCCFFFFGLTLYIPNPLIKKRIVSCSPDYLHVGQKKSWDKRCHTSGHIVWHVISGKCLYMLTCMKWKIFIFRLLLIILSSDEVPVFTEEPMSVVQKLGGSVNLRCSARPASANISWRLNGQEFGDGDFGVVLGPDSLFIPTLSNLTVGRYQCVASTGAGALASVPANVTAASE